MADGTVEVYENGKLLKDQYSPTGVFEFTDIRPKPGATYKMVAKSLSKQLEAETTIPGKAQVISIDTAIVTGQFLNKRLQVDVKVKDVPGDNYYRILVKKEDLVLNKNADGKGTPKYYLYTMEDWFSSDSPVFNSLFNNY